MCIFDKFPITSHSHDMTDGWKAGQYKTWGLRGILWKVGAVSPGVYGERYFHDRHTSVLISATHIQTQGYKHPAGRVNNQPSQTLQGQIKNKLWTPKYKTWSFTGFAHKISAPSWSEIQICSKQNLIEVTRSLDGGWEVHKQRIDYKIWYLLQLSSRNSISKTSDFRSEWRSTA